MAPTTPLVDQTLLVQPGSAADAILVGSPAWYAWLAEATSFTFIGVHGTFTAHKERRGPAREYWKAYRRRAGRLHRAYLGKSSELTLDRLNAVAADLAGGVTSAAEHDRIHPPAPTVPARMLSPPDAAVRHTDAPAPAHDDARSLHLLLTKLAIPASRPNLVSRPRLLEQLDAAIGQGQKLILLSAPAGFGKTTLLAEWLGQNDERGTMNDQKSETLVQPSAFSHPEGTRPSAFSLQPSAFSLQPSAFSLQPFKVAWLALDDNDNHLGQFLAYLIAALETVRPGIGAEAWALLRTRAAQPPSNAILTILVNALADPADRIVLVLDDYHTIRLQAIHEAVAFMLDRMPPQMHVLMTSRADPPLSLARLRVRGQLAEIRAADLRFTPAEATHFFARLRGLRLPADAVAALEARTEGWVAGLQLAALSLAQQDIAQIPTFIADFAGSHHYVFDYLADEVFERQPDHVRTFLMQTAILARLCGPLCDAVTGQDNGRSLLEHLDETNLFLIRLDSSRHWYRYHHLFRDFLQERLERAVAPADPGLLHRRASAWFEQQGLVGEAIDHALSAQEWADAMRCIAPLMEREQFYAYYLDWPRWLAALPDAVLQVDPDFCLRFAWTLVLTGHAEAAERPLDWAEAAWQAAGDQPKVGEVLSKRAVASSFMGDFPRAITLSQQALAKLPLDAVEQRAIPTYVLGRSQIALGHVETATDLLIAVQAALKDARESILSGTATLGMAWVYHLQGQLQRAAVLYQDVIRRARGTMQQPAAHIYLGILYYEWNDLAAAEQLLREGIEAGRRTGRGRYWPRVYIALMRVFWARGDAAQAGTLIEQALASARLLGRRDIVEAEAQQVWLWLAQGDLPAAVRWLTTQALNADDEVPYERQAAYLMLARIRMAQERLAPGSVDMNAIARLLDRLRQAAEADDRMADRIVILGLTALAYAAQRDPNQALACLAEALALAEPEGYIRLFVDEGTPMRSLMIAQYTRVSASERGTQLLAYIDRLLHAFPQDVPAATSESVVPELLSERERAVLQLLAAGRSVQEIATLLVISVHTARTHVKNIYAKLDAHNRVQALERARALHLL